MRERAQGEDVQEESAACKFKLWATRCAFYRQISSDATQANCALRRKLRCAVLLLPAETELELAVVVVAATWTKGEGAAAEFTLTICN